MLSRWGRARLLNKVQTKSSVAWLCRTWAALQAVCMNIDVERFWVAVDGDTWWGVWSCCWVEHLSTNSVHTDHRSARLSGGVVGVGGTGDGDPVSGTRGANNTSQGWRPSCHGEGLRWCVCTVWTGCVLDATEVSLHPDAHGVVCVGQLKTLSVVIVEGEHLTGDTSEVLQASVACYNDSIIDYRRDDII